MSNCFNINENIIGDSIYFIAELSCNHHQDINKALELIKLAKESGADAVKIQTYTGDTITFKSNKEWFKLKGTNWDNDAKNLWELFNSAYTPWEWTGRLKEETEKLGMDFFSSPFDESAVDFLEKYDMPVYKIASMEIIDIPLLVKVAKTRKPVIVSTGMASLTEIEEAVKTLKENKSGPIALLKCTSAYPAKIEDANLRTMRDIGERFNVLIGLSDHTLGMEVACSAVALGACIIEKHFIVNRGEGGPDSEFSLEPKEFKMMVETCKKIKQSLGKIHYGGVKGEVRLFRRSLFITKDMKNGEKLEYGKNYRSIRPGDGLHTRHYQEINGKSINKEIEAGTPISWDILN
jgi:pseudaminic acid synthase